MSLNTSTELYSVLVGIIDKLMQTNLEQGRTIEEPLRESNKSQAEKIKILKQKNTQLEIQLSQSQSAHDRTAFNMSELPPQKNDSIHHPHQNQKIKEPLSFCNKIRFFSGQFDICSQ